MELVLFDLDNTLLAGDSDYEWGQFLIDKGVVDRAHHEAQQPRVLRGLQGRAARYLRLSRLRPASARHPHARAARRLARRIHGHAHPADDHPAGAGDLVNRHLADADLVAVITATNSFVTAPIAREFGIPHLIATEPEQRDGRFTGEVSGTPCFREGKVTRLEHFLEAQGTRLDCLNGSWFYSDSHNDLPLLEKVRHPVAVDPDPTLRAHAEAHGWPVISLRGA